MMQGNSLTRMLADKEQAVARLQGEVAQLQQALQESERSKHKLSDMVTTLRDEVISKDLQLATARQALQTSEADHELGHAQYKLRIHTLEQQIKHMSEETQQRAQQLSEEAHASEAAWQLAQQEQVGVQDAMRQQLLHVQQSLKQEQARVLELQAELAEQQSKANSLQASLAEKEAQISNWSSTADESLQRQQAMRQELSARDAHITELQQQLSLLDSADLAKTDTQRAQLAALLASFHELRASCQQQAKGIASLQAEKQGWAKERSGLKSKIKDVATCLVTVKAECDKAQLRLNQEIASHHATQMQLTLAQHRLREASIVTGKTAQMLDASLLPMGSAPLMNSFNLTSTPAHACTAIPSTPTHAAQQLLKALEEERVASKAAADALLQEAAVATGPQHRSSLDSDESDASEGIGSGTLTGQTAVQASPLTSNQSGVASQAALLRAQAALAGFTATLDHVQQQQQATPQQQHSQQDSLASTPQLWGHLETSLAGWRNSSTHTPGRLGGYGHGMDPSAVLAAAAAANRAAAASQAALHSAQLGGTARQGPAGKLQGRATGSALNDDELKRAVAALLAGAGRTPVSSQNSKHARRHVQPAANGRAAGASSLRTSTTQEGPFSMSPTGRKPWLPAGFNP